MRALLFLIIASLTAGAQAQLYVYFLNALQDLMRKPTRNDATKAEPVMLNGKTALNGDFLLAEGAKLFQGNGTTANETMTDEDMEKGNGREKGKIRGKLGKTASKVSMGEEMEEHEETTMMSETSMENSTTTQASVAEYDSLEENEIAVLPFRLTANGQSIQPAENVSETVDTQGPVHHTEFGHLIAPSAVRTGHHIADPFDADRLKLPESPGTSVSVQPPGDLLGSNQPPSGLDKPLTPQQKRLLEINGRLPKYLIQNGPLPPFENSEASQADPNISKDDMIYHPVMEGEVMSSSEKMMEHEKLKDSSEYESVMKNGDADMKGQQMITESSNEMATQAEMMTGETSDMMNTYEGDTTKDKMMMKETTDAHMMKAGTSTYEMMKSDMENDMHQDMNHYENEGGMTHKEHMVHGNTNDGWTEDQRQDMLNRMGDTEKELMLNHTTNAQHSMEKQPQQNSIINKGAAPVFQLNEEQKSAFEEANVELLPTNTKPLMSSREPLVSNTGPMPNTEPPMPPKPEDWAPLPEGMKEATTFPTLQEKPEMPTQKPMNETMQANAQNEKVPAVPQQPLAQLPIPRQPVGPTSVLEQLAHEQAARRQLALQQSQQVAKNQPVQPPDSSQQQPRQFPQPGQFGSQQPAPQQQVGVNPQLASARQPLTPEQLVQQAHLQRLQFERIQQQQLQLQQTQQQQRLQQQRLRQFQQQQWGNQSPQRVQQEGAQMPVLRTPEQVWPQQQMLRQQQLLNRQRSQQQESLSPDIPPQGQFAPPQQSPGQPQQIPRQQLPPKQRPEDVQSQHQQLQQQQLQRPQPSPQQSPHPELQPVHQESAIQQRQPGEDAVPPQPPSNAVAPHQQMPTLHNASQVPPQGSPPSGHVPQQLQQHLQQPLEHSVSGQHQQLPSQFQQAPPNQRVPPPQGPSPSRDDAGSPEGATPVQPQSQQIPSGQRPPQQVWPPQRPQPQIPQRQPSPQHQADSQVFPHADSLPTPSNQQPPSPLQREPVLHGAPPTDSKQVAGSVRPPAANPSSPPGQQRPQS